MAIITALTLQKDKTRTNLYLDGVFVCGLEASVVYNKALKIGAELTEKELENLKLDSDREKANKYALNLVNKKRYSKNELILKLKNKEIDNKVIAEIISKMEEYHYIDDSAYVRAYVNSTKNKSKKELELKLLNKGIDKNIIKIELEELNIDEKEEAVKLSEKFMKYKENTAENLLKLRAYLYRKGFTNTAINESLKLYDFYE